jgi:photosystem II stability/assembly factor-like uncharacterized protein
MVGFAPPIVVRVASAILIALSALGGLVSPARAQLTDWRSVGPDGASILTLASQPGVPENLFAAGYAAFFRSTDGGVSWIGGGAGLPVLDTGALIVESDGTVCAGTYGAGVYRSTDGGANFAPANTGMGDVVVFSLVAGAQGVLWAGTQGSGVFVSTDGGDNWEVRSNGLPSAEVHDLLPISGDSLYAATHGGVFLTTDAGMNWSERNQGLTNLKATTLARRPDGAFLYVGTSTMLPEPSGVYRSSDGGDNWTLVATGLTNPRISDVLIDPANPDILLAGTQVFSTPSQSGIYRSTDGGDNWAQIPGNPGARDIRVLLAVGAVFLAGAAGDDDSRGGVFRSTDGEFWSRSDRGMVVMRCRTVASIQDPVDELVLGATGNFRLPGGAYRSQDGGMNWEEYSAPGLPSTVLSLRLVSSTLRYAGTAVGVWRRTAPGGEAWQATDLSIEMVRDLAQGPALSDSLLLWAATPAGVFFTSNGGTNFEPRNVGLLSLDVRALAIDPLVPSRIYAGTGDAGVFRSTDGGLAWAAYSTDLGNLEVRDLEAGTDGRLLAATAGGVFELVGDVWAARNDQLSDLDLRSLAVYRTHRFVGTPSGVFLQVGEPTEAWTQWNSGLTNLDVRAVYADTAGGRLRVFACTEGDGVFVADQPTAVELARMEVVASPGRVELRFATAWEEDHLGFYVERRLPRESDYASRTENYLSGGPEYCFVDQDSRLSAGMEVWYRLVALAANGFRETLAPFRVLIPAAGPPPAGPPPAGPAAQLQVLPNPFAVGVQLQVTGGKGGIVRIRDASGRTLRTLLVTADGLLPWDGRSESGAPLASGVYFLTLEGPGGIATSRALKVP